MLLMPVRKKFWTPGIVYGKSAGGGGGGLGLQTNLTGFWSFESTSWSDDTGLSTPTAVGSPTSVTGKVGNALGGFNGSANYLTIPHNTNISAAGTTFSAQVWVNISAPSGTMLILNKSNNAFGQTEWGFGTVFSGSNVWCVQVLNTSHAIYTVNGPNHSAGWHHLLLSYNGTTKVATFYVDGTLAGTVTIATATLQNSSAAPLNFGRHGAATLTTGALIDQCGFWKGRALTGADATLLWNSGNGLTYAGMA